MVSELGKTLRSLDGPILIIGHTGFKGTWLTLLLCITSADSLLIISA
jgi:nucleoside-diphosphate-sugar epimerase